MMRIVRFVALMAACLLYPLQAEEARSDQYGHDGNLIVWIEADKLEYNIGEAITIKFTISNFTTVPLIVNKRLHPSGDLKWDLFHEGFGMIRTKTIPFEPLKDTDFIRMEVNDEIDHFLPELHEMFDIPFKAGRYALRLTYTNKEKPTGKDKSLEGETWTGLIVTNQIWIEIKTPEKI